MKGSVGLKVTKQEYSNMADKASPGSKTLRNCVLAFLSGGVICTIGQIITNMCKSSGMELQEARITTSILLVFLGAFLTAVGLYDNLAKHAGAGSLVPITGFANSIVAPAIEFKSEGYVMGIGAKMFVIAGPVLVYGIATSAVYGIILYIANMFI